MRWGTIRAFAILATLVAVTLVASAGVKPF
jgi:hypothetical protein